MLSDSFQFDTPLPFKYKLFIVLPIKNKLNQYLLDIGISFSYRSFKRENIYKTG